MNAFLRTRIIIAAALGLFGLFFAAEAKAQGLTTLLTKMERFNNARQNLQADVTMEKRNAQLDETDVYEGKVWYVPAKGKSEMGIRLNWLKPTEESLLVINGLYRLVRPRLKTEYRGKVEKAKNNASVAGPLSFMSMSKKQLNDNYTGKILGEETLRDGTRAIRLELTPKKAQKYKLAEIWVDGSGKPLQMKVVENNNDSTIVLLTNTKDNVKFPDNIWAIDTPKGTKVINN